MVSDFNKILDDDQIQLVTSAAVPSERCAVGMQVLNSGKHYFTDKSPFTTLEQLKQAREKVKQTGLKYAVFYSERIANECSVYAGQLIKQGAIGRVLQVINLAPHNLGAGGSLIGFFKKKNMVGF